MNTTHTITAILAEILDLDQTAILPETYVIRDLQAESIDLLEIGVALQHRLGITVDDDQLFLKNIRIILARCEKQGRIPQDALEQAFPHLAGPRLNEIMSDLAAGPVLRVTDLIAYAEHALRSRT